MAEDNKILTVILLAGAGVGGYFLYKYFKEKEEEPEPGYPKTISRGPYSFTVYNQQEEIQMKEFLGIDPPGKDIDTYLSELAQEDLDYWKNYWINIWTGLERQDIVDFVIQMYNKYSGVGVSARIDSFTITA